MESALSSKYASTQESQNFAKLMRLFVDLLRDVLWETLTKRILPEELPEKVRQNKQKLETVGKMREDQYMRICKNDRGRVSNEDFDITLLYMLLRNLPMKAKIQRPSKGWGSDVFPNKKHLTEGDDIERIQLRKTQVCGHVGRASLSMDAFDQIWADMLAVVKRFDIRLNTTFEREMEIILKDEMPSELGNYMKDYKIESAKSSKYASTPESQNFATLIRLFVDLLRDVLWETLTKRILPEELPEKVRQNKQKLERDGNMREDQYRRICRPGGGEVTNDDFDITLLYMLLRNLPMEENKIHQPTKGWRSDIYPDEKDLTEGDDIERIRLRRNHVFGHLGRASLSKDKFDQIWADMLAVVKRFDIRLNTTFESEMNVILMDRMPSELDHYMRNFEKIKEYDLNTSDMEATSESAEVKKLVKRRLGETENINGIPAEI